MSRSPLKSKPLSNPGDSLQESLNDLVFSDVLVYFVAGVMLFMMAISEWIRWYTLSPPNPGLYTAIAIGYGLFAGIKIRGAYKKA